MRDAIYGFLDSGKHVRSEVEPYLATLPRERFGGFGGNTPCVQVFSPKTSLIIDGGSGLRLHGYELMKGPCGQGKGEVHILFTHFHWDHLIGLPFFTPLFIPGNTIHVYAVQPELPDVFRTLFKKPYFPVPLEGLGARIVYHQLEPRKAIEICGDGGSDERIRITPYQLDHPDPCWGYRFERKGRVFAYCVDTECTRVSREDLGPDLPLYQGVHAMIFDAQYTLMEAIEKVNWGHAAASLGLDIGIRERIERVYFMHHDPASNDAKIAAAEALARKYYKGQIRNIQRGGEAPFQVDWCFAHEGLTFNV